MEDGILDRSGLKRAAVNRRQVLRGAGGAVLGLPLLPSLLPKGARAQTRLPVRFFLIATGHGAVRAPNMVPPESALTQTHEMFPGHTIRSGPLVPVVADGQATLSPVLRASASLLTPRLAAKLNVLRGFDVHFYLAHHSGGHLGNFAATSGGTAVTQHRITIDQVMGYSNSFYESLSGVRRRVLQAGEWNNGLSWGYSNPTAGTGPIQRMTMPSNIPDIFREALGDLDVGGMAGTESPARRPSIVNRVLESYRRLRDGNRRLSREDRRRLDDHMARIAELERRVSDSRATASAACSGVVQRYRNADDVYPRRAVEDATRFYQTAADILVGAFLCGTSRIALLEVGNDFTNYSGNWHQDIAHQYIGPGPQARLVEGNQRVFERVFLHVASQLDSVAETGDGPGGSYLDNTHLVWSQESGTYTHDLQHAYVVTAGSAGGFFRTGQYIDYRNRVPSRLIRRYEVDALPAAERQDYTGLSWRQYLGAILQAMRVPREAYERPGEPGGYGDPHAEPEWRQKCVPEVFSRAGEVPMLLRA